MANILTGGKAKCMQPIRMAEAFLLVNKHSMHV